MPNDLYFIYSMELLSSPIELARNKIEKMILTHINKEDLSKNLISFQILFDISI